MKTLTLALSATFAFAASTALAQGPTIVRGTVTAMTDASLTVNTLKGPQEVALTPTWNVAVTKPVAVDAIKAGSFIGTSEIPSADGSTGTSLEVHVFPPGVKMGEGHYGWDLQPGSMMTNGTVGAVVGGKAGSRELDVTYGTTQRHITVPPNVPVVQIVGGSRDMVKVGVPVFLVVQKTPTGLKAGSVSVGENGAAPPM